VQETMSKFLRTTKERVRPKTLVNKKGLTWEGREKGGAHISGPKRHMAADLREKKKTGGKNPGCPLKTAVRLTEDKQKEPSKRFIHIK